MKYGRVEAVKEGQTAGRVVEDGALQCKRKVRFGFVLLRSFGLQQIV